MDGMMKMWLQSRLRLPGAPSQPLVTCAKTIVKAGESTDLESRLEDELAHSAVAYSLALPNKLVKHIGTLEHSVAKVASFIS